MNVSVQVPCWGVNYGMGYNAFTVRQKDFVAADIQWFERWENIGQVPVSHTFIISGPDETVEAFGDGVQKGTVSAYLNDPNVALLMRRPRQWCPEMGQNIVAAAAKHIGERYNYGLIFTMAISNTFLGHWLDKLTKGWFSRTLDHWADSKRADICSSLVARADSAAPEIAGLGILTHAPYTIMPVDLFDDAWIYELGAVELVSSIPSP